MSNRQTPDVPVDLELGELPDYRPISGFAFLALLAGLAAAAALTLPVFWCLPPLGLVFSIVALRRMATADRPMVGRKAALWGLALSLFFGVAAPTRFFTQHYWLQSRAEHVAEHWFEALRTGNTQAAYELMLHVGATTHPPPKTHAAATADAADETQTALQVFAKSDQVARLLALGNEARPQCLGANIIHDELGRDTVLLLYQVSFPGEDVLHPLGVYFYVQRRLEPGGERWLITNVTHPSR